MGFIGHLLDYLREEHYICTWESRKDPVVGWPKDVELPDKKGSRTGWQEGSGFPCI
ncbi:MAG: hypothetical protein JXC85_04105 [Candidatus Aenigmarchaeota archaeon]|nr:hypothetical protein [Candidatus Aenigmarchaeota archaeon]